MILKNTEYMICCDSCGASLTDYFSARNQKEAVALLTKEWGLKKHKGNYLCDDCKNGKSPLKQQNCYEPTKEQIARGYVTVSDVRSNST